MHAGRSGICVFIRAVWYMYVVPGIIWIMTKSSPRFDRFFLEFPCVGIMSACSWILLCRVIHCYMMLVCLRTSLILAAQLYLLIGAAIHVPFPFQAVLSYRSVLLLEGP